MLKKIIRYCLITSAAGMLAMPVNALEFKGTVLGKARAKTTNTENKNGSVSYSVIEMETEATAGYEASLTEGSWTGTGSLEFDLNSSGAEVGNRSVTLENESVSFAMGNWDADSADITIGKGYLDWIDQSMAVGNSAFESSDGDYIKAGLKTIGLEFTLGANDLGDSDETGDDGIYSETLISAMYGGEFGDLTLNASLTSISEKINKDQNSGGKDCIHDGGTKTEAALGVGYKVSNMLFALNIDQLTIQKGGNPTPDEEIATTMIFAFDMALSDDSGISAVYGSMSADDGSKNLEQTTGIDIGYKKTIAGVDLSVAYSTVSAKDDDAPKKDESTSVMGVGLTYNF